MPMDALDKTIINSLQGGFPVSETPFNDVATGLGIDESTLISRLEKLLADNILTRFGPMYDIQKLGGAFSLCAIRVPEERFEEVSDLVNSFDEVAHNYQRDHEFNMWYVLATETPEQITQINQMIEVQTHLKVYNMPKIQEFFVELKLMA